MGGGFTSSIQAARLAHATDRAANTEISEVVPAGYQWELRALSVSLVQGITQTPQPILQILTPADAEDETQTLTLSDTPTAGDAKIQFNAPARYGTTAATAAIGFADWGGAAALQTALRLIAGLEDVTVGGVAGGPYTVTFTGGGVGGIDIPLLTITDNTLKNAGADDVTVAVAQTNAGVQGGVLYEALGSSAAQAASSTCRYTWAVGLETSGQIGATPNIHSYAPLPEGLVLQPGTRITTVTLGKGANTNYGRPSLYVVEHG